MRILVKRAAPLVLGPLLPFLLASLLASLIAGCALEQPAPPAAPAAVQAESAPPAPAVSEAAVLNQLNVLVNDTVPASDEYAAKRQALAPALASPVLADGLRRVLAQTLAFEPPRLRQRWEDNQKAQADAASLYAANPPVDTRALEGARVLRRLGPALHLVRLPSGDTVFLASARKFKKNARIKGLFVLERLRPTPDAAKGDLVDELEDQPRTFAEITRQEAKELELRRAPALAELRRLEARNAELERDVAADLARLDALTRDVNAVISTGILVKGSAPAPATLIRKVKRVAKSYSREQYYRYALPVTGLPKVDAVLAAHLDERRAEVQALLKSTGVGRGRARANMDRIAFQAYTASNRLLSIRFEELRDTGGAHPNTTYTTFVFDLGTQAQLKLTDIFSDTPAALVVLSQLAERRLTLALDGLLFPEGFSPTANNFSVFVLDGADIVFTFPPYQVASYAQGTQTLRVPLCHPRLAPLLTTTLRKALLGSLSDVKEARERGDDAATLKIALPLAEAGDSYAQLVVAVVYLKSPEGLSTGLYWCNKAASQDNLLAQQIIQHLQGVFGKSFGSSPKKAVGKLAPAIAPAR